MSPDVLLLFLLDSLITSFPSFANFTKFINSIVLFATTGCDPKTLD